MQQSCKARDFVAVWIRWTNGNAILFNPSVPDQTRAGSSGAPNANHHL
ncbi:hypothetical protein BH09MYX1_BH09MYX1_53800 [soil metagenome]